MCWSGIVWNQCENDNAESEIEVEENLQEILNIMSDKEKKKQLWKKNVSPSHHLLFFVFINKLFILLYLEIVNYPVNIILNFQDIQ